MDMEGPLDPHTFSVAPMMEYTDRHCRYFHRLLTRKALLYTEMITANALVRGDRSQLLRFNRDELPVALQLGGSDPRLLAEAAFIGQEEGYSEINLNVGCPSDRVQDGAFGVCLMKVPATVGEAIAAIQQRISIPVTVKHRIGVDDLDQFEDMARFVEIVSSAGCRRFIVHARKAWLKGLSPKENRQIPPLCYDHVYRLKRTFPHLAIEINGGINSLEEAERHLRQVDGVMVGRMAYHHPYLLASVDSKIFKDVSASVPTREQVIQQMLPYIQRHMSEGRPLRHVSRHLLGLFYGQNGSRLWKRLLTNPSEAINASLLVQQALAATAEQT